MVQPSISTMKTLLCSLLATAACTALLADDSALGAITTKNGRAYQNCRILQTEPDGVTFRHSRGIAKILYLHMHEDLRNHLGYDAKKAAKYEAELVAKREKEKKDRIARVQQIQKAQAEARVAALGRAGMWHLQNLFGAGQAAVIQQSYPALVPAVGLFGGGLWGLPSSTSFGFDHFHGALAGYHGSLTPFGGGWFHDGRHVWRYGNHGSVTRPLDLDVDAIRDSQGRIIHRDTGHRHGRVPVLYQQQGVRQLPFGVPALGASPVLGAPPVVPVVRGGVSRPVSAAH